jgi:hypothetical protein
MLLFFRNCVSKVGSQMQEIDPRMWCNYEAQDWSCWINGPRGTCTIPPRVWRTVERSLIVAASSLPEEVAGRPHEHSLHHANRC